MKGVLCTVLGGMCWGFSGSCGQFLFATYGLDARWLTTVRNVERRGDSGAGGHAEKQAGNEVGVAEKRDVVRLILFAILGLVTSQFTYLMAISYSNAGTATVLQHTGPVLILAYLCIRTLKPPKKREVVAIVSLWRGPSF